MAPTQLTRTVAVHEPVPVPAPTLVDPRTRSDQVQDRLAERFHRVDVRQSEGCIGPYRADDLWDCLHRVRQEADDMISQRRDGLSRDEQRVLNNELGAVAHDIGR